MSKSSRPDTTTGPISMWIWESTPCEIQIVIRSRLMLATLFPEADFRIEHVGSTAVMGLTTVTHSATARTPVSIVASN